MIFKAKQPQAKIIDNYFAHRQIEISQLRSFTGHAVDVACFTWKQEIKLCSLVLLIALLQNDGILTGLVIALTVLFQSRKRLYWSMDFFVSSFFSFLGY